VLSFSRDNFFDELGRGFPDSAMKATTTSTTTAPTAAVTLGFSEGSAFISLPIFLGGLVLAASLGMLARCFCGKACRDVVRRGSDCAWATWSCTGLYCVYLCSLCFCVAVPEPTPPEDVEAGQSTDRRSPPSSGAAQESIVEEAVLSQPSLLASWGSSSRDASVELSEEEREAVAPRESVSSVKLESEGGEAVGGRRREQVPTNKAGSRVPVFLQRAVPGAAALATTYYAHRALSKELEGLDK